MHIFPIIRYDTVTIDTKEQGTAGEPEETTLYSNPSEYTKYFVYQKALIIQAFKITFLAIK